MTGRLLIADDTATHRIILKARLTEAAYHVQVARDHKELTRLVVSFAPEVVLLSAPFCSRGAADLMQSLRALPGQTKLPIILLQEATDRDARIAAIQSGADAVLGALPEMTLLGARVRNLMRRSALEAELHKNGNSPALSGFAEATAGFDPSPGQIALVAGSLAEGLAWRNGLKDQVRDRIVVLDPARALRDLEDLAPQDAIVVSADAASPDDALDLIANLRCRAETLNSAILLTQDQPDLALTVAALDKGVSDVAPEGFDPTEMSHLLRREIARKVFNDRCRAELQDGLRLANTDPLTGLHNRRSALAHLGRVAQNAQERAGTFAVMVLDLDRFKAVNDTYGHAAGDAVLVEVTRRMSACLRQGDFIARIGGEEFLAVIRNTNSQSARTAAERLRKAVAVTPVTLPSSDTSIDVTVSIGIVLCGPSAANGGPADLIELADRGLYAAKTEGRNQVTLFQHAA